MNDLQKISLNLQGLVTLVVKILCLIQPNQAMLYVKLTKAWFARFRHRVKHNGLAHAIKVNKEERLLVFQFLSGTPLTQSNIPRTALLRNGLPKFPFITELGGDVWSLRFLTTLMSISRFYRLPPNPDLTAVTDKYKGPFTKVHDAFPSNYEITRAIRSLTPETGMNIDTNFKAFHSNNRTSPLGLPSLVSSVIEASILVRKFPTLLESIRTLSGSKIVNILTRLGVSALPGALNIMLNKQYKAYQHLRRISVIPDKEGKSRIICLLDYWSQAALKPIHDHFLGLLRRIPSDLTFDQARIPLDSIGTYVQSADLTSATDRFPLAFQLEVLKEFIGEEKARAWGDLLTSYPFTYLGVNYTYGVGQPLGAYSSWAVFSYCHHIIVRIAIMRRYSGSKGWNDLYRILGDDIVIFDEQVASEYFKLMHNLGVEVSKQKTFTSDCFFELAKRQFFHSPIGGEWTEITAFPFAGINEAVKTPPQLYAYFESTLNKGWREIESFLYNSSIIISLKKFYPYIDSPTYNYVRDFFLSRYSVTNLEQARRFLEGLKELKIRLMFEGYDLEDTVLKSFRLAEIEYATRDFLNAKTFQVAQQYKILKLQVINSSSLEFEGTGIEPTPEGAITLSDVPYLVVWKRCADEYFAEKWRFEQARYSGSLMEFLQGSSLNYRVMPDIDAMKFVERSKEDETMRQLKITRLVIAKVIRDPIDFYERLCAKHQEFYAAMGRIPYDQFTIDLNEADEPQYDNDLAQTYNDR